ncbi:MAG TPA: DUF3179 domain-containing protein [Jiangellaceae bacterium]
MPVTSTGIATAVVVVAVSVGAGLVFVSRTANAPTIEPDREYVVEEYPDRIARELDRLAAEPRPVTDSALPPRHLDAEMFPTTLVDRNLIVSGGPPPDGIPAIDDPQFAPAGTIDWLTDTEPVLVLQLDGQVRAYPVQVMMWHEIVNDQTGQVPVTVTYCPLCNSGVAFDPRVGGRVLEFGTSGALYQSALVMYDRQTESLWTHFDGQAVVGTLVGEQLRMVPLSAVSWQDFTVAHPDAPVLTRDTGYERPYGRNPYVGYGQGDGPLTGFVTGESDDRLVPMARVVGVHVQGASGQSFPLAVPTADLAELGIITTRVDGRQVTVWHIPGTVSSLDGQNVADGDDVGATGVFYTDHEAGSLRFTRKGDKFVDEQTGSTWNVLGEAVEGPLAGERLEPVPHVDTFWFAWSAYQPDTTFVQQ